MKNKILSYLNFILIGLTLFLASLIVFFHETPEGLLEGNWEETGWYYEKVGSPSLSGTDKIIENEIKKELLAHIPPLQHEIWSFRKAEKNTFVTRHNNLEYVWLIKGRGNILELRKNNQPIESFVIQKLNENELVLHLNMDLQTRGIIRIELKKDNKHQYVKKI